MGQKYDRTNPACSQSYEIGAPQYCLSRFLPPAVLGYRHDCMFWYLKPIKAAGFGRWGKEGRIR